MNKKKETKMKISIIVPIYNEEENINPLYTAVKNTMDKIENDYELIYVNDGSTDNTEQTIKEIAGKHSQSAQKGQIISLNMRKNFGQTAAMDAGIKHATGDIIITMDGDLQNDPEDIPKLIQKIQQGSDIVVGWRYNRKDKILKNLMSRTSWIIRRILLNEKIHDSGCSLKAYKKECFNGVDLYGEGHRYLHLTLALKGYKITEIKVKHHPRKYGKTKYNYKRIIKGFLDLLTIWYFTKYSSRPMHFFGTIGIANFLLGIIIGLYLVIGKIVQGWALADRPMLLLVVLLIVLGVMFLIFGIIGELIMRIYYKTHNENYYSLKEDK